MLRRLLTLLALITGLAATGAHAEMRMAGMQDVRLEAVGGSAVSACQAAALVAKAGLSQALRKKPAQQGYCPLPTVTVIIPTVYIGADRTRE